MNSLGQITSRAARTSSSVSHMQVARAVWHSSPLVTALVRIRSFDLSTPGPVVSTGHPGMRIYVVAFPSFKGLTACGPFGENGVIQPARVRHRCLDKKTTQEIVGARAVGVPTYEHKEYQPWPRASGLSSRTTVVVHACMVSGCVCVPARVVRSSTLVAARAAQSSRPDLHNTASPGGGSARRRNTPVAIGSVMASIHRISTRSDFSRTLKKGVRVSSRDLLLTLSILPTRWPDDTGRRVDVATSGGPWLGLIVSKSVGNAVTRHLVARRIRAAFAEVMDEFPTTDISVVVRALPSAAEASSVELAEQLRKALRNAKVRRLAAEVLDAPRPFSTESADGAL